MNHSPVPNTPYGDALAALSGVLTPDEELVFIGRPDADRRLLATLTPVLLLAGPFCIASFFEFRDMLMSQVQEIHPIWGIPGDSLFYFLIAGCLALLLIFRLQFQREIFDRNPSDSGGADWFWRPIVFAITDQRVLKISEQDVSVETGRSGIKSISLNGSLLTLVIQANDVACADERILRLRGRSL